MKLTIQAEINEKLLEAVARFGRETNYSRDQIIEMALNEFFHKRGVSADEIVTSNGYFTGDVSRIKTYEC